jgi:hypothetical protein
VVGAEGGWTSPSDRHQVCLALALIYFPEPSSYSAK